MLEEEQRKETQPLILTGSNKDQTGKQGFTASVRSFRWGKRHTLGLLLICCNILCYLDRANMSIAIIPMAQDLEFDDEERGLVLSAFYVGYWLTQIVGAITATSYGAKWVLTVGVFGWSLCTLITPFAAQHSIVALFVVRAVLGVFEGLNFPALSSFIGLWFPENERIIAITGISSGLYIGTILANLLFPQVSIEFGWPWIFYISASVGFVWMIFFIYFVSSFPKDHKTISKEELDMLNTEVGTRTVVPVKDVPWKKFAKCKPLWWACMLTGAMSYGFFLITSWLPSYFEYLGVPLKDVGWFTFVPYLAMILGANSAGLFVRAFRSKFTITTLRKMVQTFATLVGAGFILGLMYIANAHNVAAALTFMVCTMACFAMGQAGYWSALQDISPPFAGYAIGFGNTVGSVAGFLSNFLTGYLLKQYPGQWWIVFSSILGTSVTGTLLWDIFGSAELVDFSD